jgi:hypothetical protein
MSEGLESETSDHAKLGTLAHEYSENILRRKLGLIGEKEFNKKTMELRANPLYNTDLDEEVEPYITLVLEQVAEARGVNPDALVMIEQKVSLEVYVEEGFGTCDLIIIADGVMYVTDLKFGKGVRVSAVWNSQLMLYALGALEAFGILYDLETVRLTISQPRLDAISTWDISAEELLSWAEDFVRPQAELAFKGEGEHQPGEWCRFCKAKVFCPALKEEALMLADADFDVADAIGEDADEGVLEIFKIADRVEEFLASVKAHVYKLAMEGKKWPGYKLIKTKGRRSIQDEASAITVLQKAGYDKAVYLNTTIKLKGLGDLKKNLGEVNRDKLLGDLMIQSEGKPALVLDTDDRAEMSKADDFL